MMRTTVLMIALGATRWADASAQQMPADAGRGDLYNPLGRTEPDAVPSEDELIAWTVQAPPKTTESVRKDKDVVATLTVTGEAELQKPADQMRIALGVVTEGDDAQAAMAENSKRMNEVIAALKGTGLTKEEYETGQFQIQPRYSRPPRREQAPEDWKPRIIGYQVTNRLNIKTKKLDKAGDLLKAASEAGANSVDSISFDLADRRTYRAEAIRKATVNAKSDASALAEAADQRLVRVISINLDHATAPPPPQPFMMERGMAAADMMETPPIQPGEITIHANVTLVYEIAPLQ
ncbi:MAG: SIMPL domain-containing protein [Phycisphaerales bacterium]|nr:SIMPL domain-containing protein [Phycisphaerales bacterium]MCI0629401.1 SIMPL domain-containing protein [Phycisphaerales bacterium]MCI0674633.1 SIMPL domain-containing protein [Phycisphaerales bacterium]